MNSASWGLTNYVPRARLSTVSRNLCKAIMRARAHWPTAASRALKNIGCGDGPHRVTRKPDSSTGKLLPHVD